MRLESEAIEHSLLSLHGAKCVVDLPVSLAV
jgi:hypothetical protein